MSEDVAADVLEALVRAYYGPLGWDVDELDRDDLRECMRAMEPVAALVAERERAAGVRALRDAADQLERIARDGIKSQEDEAACVPLWWLRDRADRIEATA